MIYADCAAQRPPRKCAIEAAEYAMRVFGNPSGAHDASSKNAQLLFDARKKTAAAIGAKPDEIIFTASGTEADNTAVYSAVLSGRQNGRDKLLIFSAEHNAVLSSAKAARDIFGCEVQLIPCRSDGTVDLTALSRMADEKTALISIMAANNETGVLQPLEAAAKIAKDCGALFHTDAVQSVGQVETDVNTIKCDLLSLSAHKFGGIVGAGVLYCRTGVRLNPLIHGGGHERGRRSGTQAVPAIYAMGAAIKEAAENIEKSAQYVSALRDRLQAELEAMGGMIIGKTSPRLPGTCCVCFEGRDGEELALRLNRLGICVSSGAACSTGSNSASHVLTAMGIDEKTARGALRFSFCSENTAEEIEIITKQLKTII